MKIFHIGAFFKLASDWFQTGFILAQRISDCVFIFQIASYFFRFISNWKSLKKSNLDWQSGFFFQTGSLKINKLNFSLKNR